MLAILVLAHEPDRWQVAVALPVATPDQRRVVRTASGSRSDPQSSEADKSLLDLRECFL